MGPKTRRVTRSSQSTASVTAESNLQAKSRKTNPSSKNQPCSTSTVSNAECLKDSIHSEPRCADDTQSKLKSSQRESRKKTLNNISHSSTEENHCQLAQSPQSKKKRFDSGHSHSSELAVTRSDSIFEAESNSKNTSLVSNEENSEKQLHIEFPEHKNAQELLPTCSRLWPNFYSKSTNVYHYFCNRSLGKLLPTNKKAVADQHIKSVGDFEVLGHDKPFGSRITTIDWHPRKQSFFCATSKHGDLGFYKFDAEIKGYLQPLKTYAGIGPGGYISAFKFHPSDNEKFYTSTLEGKVVLGNLNFGGSHVEKVLLSTGTWDFWYCSMDVSPKEDYIVAGRNNGMTVMCTTSGKPIWERRLHLKKVTHAELSPREPHILCTASLDHSVRVWDLRMMREVKNKPLPLDELSHGKGVNSAYFSLTDGTRLLTTDQHDEIRVYRAPFWHLETTILHPHRFFRHLTPHKAYWHPLADKIIVGRYPGDASRPEFGLERTIDIFDAATGKMHCELKDMRYNGLISLCKFNNTGDAILSAMGFQITMWWKESEDDMNEEKSKHPCSPGLMTVQRPNSSRQRKQKQEDKKVAKIKLSKMRTK